MANRWRGYGHPELYTMINSGPGAAASEPQTAYWQSLTKELTQVDEELNTKLTNMGASWEGQAAESAKSGLTPLAEWASDAETGSSVMRTSSELQADYVSDARSSMPEPVKVTTPSPSGWQMAAAAAGALTGNPGPAVAVAAQAADHEAQESAQNEAEQKAVQTMQSYESSSTWNRDTLGTFVAPPDVVVSTPEPQGGTGGAVVGPNSTTGANAQGSSQPTTSSHATIPTTGNPSGTGGGFVPSGGTTTPPTTVPTGTGTGVAPIPAATTPSGLAPLPGQPPINTLPVQPGPGVGNPPVSPSVPGANPLFPGLPGNNGQPLPATGNGGTGPLTGGNRGPIVGRGPLPGGNPGGLPVNAGDAARRAAPIRGGLPAGGAGAFEPENVRNGSQYGRPGFGGGSAVPGESAVGRSGPGAASAAGGRGAAGMGARGAAGLAGARGNGVTGPANGRGTAGAMGAGGRRADGEDDDERFAPDYLLETEDIFGDDRRIVPGVIGETPPQD
jgi:hypothetical protein